MAASFVPWNISHMAWIAWVPLISQLLPVDLHSSCKNPFRLGFLTGFIFWMLTIHWLHHVTYIGMIALAAYLALYVAIWAVVMTRFYAHWKQVKGWTHILIATMGASTWVALEWIRGWMLGGFSWNFAGVSQHQNLALIQIAEWTGVYGVSFVIIFFNISLWLTWRRLKLEKFSAGFWRYEFSAAIFLIALCLFIGMRYLLKNRDHASRQISTLKLALVQPNIPQEMKYEALSREEQSQRLHRLTLAAAATKPDLIIWPESSLVDGPSFDITSRYWLQQIVQEIHAPILLGTLDVSPQPPEHHGEGRWRRKYYNTALLVKPDGTMGPAYHKLHLVPFGEYIPFERWLPWMRWFTPIPGSFTPGDKAVLFDCDDFKIGALICFEDTFPFLSRNLSVQGADILVNLTNDAWFKTSSGAAMHAANSMFRAIETRHPLVRCTNHGFTLVISPSGQIVSTLNPFTDGFLIVPLTCEHHTPRTFYTCYGDWLPIVSCVISISALACTFHTNQKSSTDSGGLPASPKLRRSK